MDRAVQKNETKLRSEQLEIIHSSGDLACVAVAGSGKTTTLLHYALARPSQKILFLAFNRSVREEVKRKLAHLRCTNVVVETVHSLAHKYLKVGRRYTIAPSGNISVADIVRFCGLTPPPHSPNRHLVLARHILQCLVHYTNSSARWIADIDYPSTIPGSESRVFAEAAWGEILHWSRHLMGEMLKGNVPITHDVYLKIFQLQHPVLSFDSVMLDEGQDCNPAILDIFLRQDKATKIIVGDPHQQIYGFRHAVNSFESIPFPTYRLTASFRFQQDIADLAMQSLALKSRFTRYQPVTICGCGSNGNEEVKTRAIIGRSNLRLLESAIERMLCSREEKYYFEGGFQNYTCLGKGNHLFDVVNLMLDQLERVRNPYLRSFQNYDNFKEYLAITNDRDLGLLDDIASRYGGHLFKLIGDLKSRQTDRERADWIFSSVHKAKGAEFDHVQLCEDFICGEKLERILKIPKQQKGKVAPPLSENELSESVNLLYVAITRAKKEIRVPFSIAEKESGLDPAPSSPGPIKVMPVY